MNVSVEVDTSAATARARPRVAGAPVSLANVTKRFGRAEETALQDVTVRIEPGEFTCLVGPSGCGKSTLLSIVAGLEKPTSGAVTIGGRAADVGRSALMFQESALLPWLTAGQNVELALRLRGQGRAERRERAHELLALVRLGKVFDRRPHELSGGMRQRVAMARALAQQADVLLMDEPFAAVDAITQDALQAELLRIWRETGLTVLFVTHNVREAVRLGDRVLLMSCAPGRIAHDYPVRITGDRYLESAEVATIAGHITHRLFEEIRSHAR
ncbi:MAG TPA: ABC transporter ATP-binding protein [Pseudonocardiaceae bacterium]|nr:ABC transporter ATP-binding protein [Pseudonocardiaceae bacterium]